MVCIKCKKEIPDGALFCPWCGRKQVQERRARTRGNGMGTVYQLPDKTWKAVVTLGYDVSPDGKVRRKTRVKRGLKTKKEALEWLPKLKAAPVQVPKDITFSALYKLWLPSHEKDVSRSTMDCYKAAFKHFEPIWYVKMSELKTAGMQACLDAVSGKRTQQNMKALGTQLYRYAAKNDLVSKNYAELLDVGGAAQAPREPFTEDELETMWRVYRKIPGLELVLVLCYTGFRLEEFLNLTGADLHKDSLSGEDFWYFIGGEKTEAGKNRMVAISPKILPIVISYRKPGYIFSDDGKKIPAKRFRETIYYPALEQAGLPRRSPHCCRHTYATLMKKVDCVSDKDKMASIGHTSMTMTSHYTHADKASQKLLAESL